MPHRTQSRRNPKKELIRSALQARMIAWLGTATSLASFMTAYGVALLGQGPVLPWLLFGCLWIVLTVRSNLSGAIVDAEGVAVRNPLSTFGPVSWDEVREFELAPWGVVRAMGWMRLTDGRAVHIFGIQGSSTFYGAAAADEAAEALLMELSRLRDRYSDFT